MTLFVYHPLGRGGLDWKNYDREKSIFNQLKADPTDQNDRGKTCYDRQKLNSADQTDRQLKFAYN